MKQTLGEHIALAKEWGANVPEGAEGWRVTCLALALEVERIHKVHEDLKAKHIKFGAAYDAVMGALKGDEPSEFMRSYPDVEYAWWTYRIAFPR